MWHYSNMATQRGHSRLYVTKQLVFKWLNRRSQKASFKRKGFEAYLEHYPLPERRIVHHLYTLSFVSWDLLKSRVLEICKHGSVRGVDVLSNGRILWHSSIEREEKPGTQSMPKWESYITSTRPKCHLEIRVFYSLWKRWLFEEFWHFTIRENGTIFGAFVRGSMRSGWLV